MSRVFIGIFLYYWLVLQIEVHSCTIPENGYFKLLFFDKISDLINDIVSCVNNSARLWSKDFDFDGGLLHPFLYFLFLFM